MPETIEALVALLNQVEDTYYIRAKLSPTQLTIIEVLPELWLAHGLPLNVNGDDLDLEAIAKTFNAHIGRPQCLLYSDSWEITIHVLDEDVLNLHYQLTYL